MPNPVRPLALALALAAALSGCKEEKSSRGLEVLPDMFHSPAYESQQALTGTAPGAQPGARQTWHAPMLLAPPAGTVARDGAAYAAIPAAIEAANALVNPLLPTTETLRVGYAKYRAICQTCHGPEGDAGRANIADFFPAPSLNDVNVVSYTDGGLFHIISRGKGRMPAAASQLSERERWAVVHYLRAQSWAALASRDLDQVVNAAQGELRLHPEDPKLAAQVAEGRKLLEQRAIYMDLLKQGGDGREFHPAPPPRPEWEKPNWPGLEKTPTRSPLASGQH